MITENIYVHRWPQSCEYMTIQHANIWTNSCNHMTHGVMQVNRCPDCNNHVIFYYIFQPYWPHWNDSAFYGWRYIITISGVWIWIQYDSAWARLPWRCDHYGKHRQCCWDHQKDDHGSIQVKILWHINTFLFGVFTQWPDDPNRLLDMHSLWYCTMLYDFRIFAWK